jgi:hypothetical protein
VTPYVAVKMGGRVIHRTGYASSDTSSVIYTLTEGCFFSLDISLLEFFCAAGGMTFLVKGQDTISFKGGIVGRAIVPRLARVPLEECTLKSLAAMVCPTWIGEISPQEFRPMPLSRGMAAAGLLL